MATAVAGTDLMSNSDMRPMTPTVVIRFATWMLPEHRKDWAAAMFNETAYIGSRRAGVHWALGCTLLAIRARASYELDRTFSSRRTLKALSTLGAALVLAMTGVYLVQKPYQRERIRITVLHSFGASTPHHMKTVH